jgi:hypothetical protein
LQNVERRRHRSNRRMVFEKMNTFSEITVSSAVQTCATFNVEMKRQRKKS